MEGLHKWLEAQLAEHKTEPNSGLGQAIRYLLRHWQPLTLFLRQAGAPVDNNLCTAANGGQWVVSSILCKRPCSFWPMTADSYSLRPAGISQVAQGNMLTSA